MATIKNKKLILKRPTINYKVYKNKEVWFTRFTNYIVIMSTFYIYPTNLYKDVALNKQDPRLLYNL
jgi:hypothetical protein